MDFFLFLRDQRKLTLPTLKGYRSALAAVLRLREVDLSTSQELSTLFKAFAREAPVVRSPTPKWDLALVLDSLTSPPYEPIFTADIKFITRKTVFLLAFASAKRVSELQGLTSVVAHPDDWSSATLTLDPAFLAKTELASDPLSRTFTIPSLSLASDDADRSLCPVRSLRAYLARTLSRRVKDSRLFIPFVGERSAVSRNTISLWIKDVVRRAYSSASQDQLRLHQRSAHEVRALATSWAFSHCLSLRDVMEAATWRSHSTFSSFYFRDTSLVSDGVYRLGPVVAAQRVVFPSASNRQ